jgi:predicted Zn finger-like uncharacterized protein
VVVVCESCSTRFQLDESRIPPKGTLVRCSRCKATFIARPPAASFEETVQDVVAEVTQAGGAPVPEPAEDLFDTSGDDLGETRGRAKSDEAWEFEEAPAEKPPSPTLGITGTPAHAPEPTAPPVEEIGSPEEWDLLGDSVSEAASEATFVEPERAPDPERAPAPVKQAPVLAQRAAEPARRSLAPARARLEGRVAGLGRAAALAGRTLLHATAWLALAGAFSLGVARVAPRGPALVAPAQPSRVIPLPDGEARGVEVRFVENAFAGTLFVVQGELARGGFDPALGLRVYWVDDSGARLGDGTWGGPAPTSIALRERAPEALRAEGLGAARPAPQHGAFAALFESVPEQATGVALALEPLPTPPVAAALDAPASAAPDQAASAGEPPAGATASSPPAPRPSSE